MQLLQLQKVRDIHLYLGVIKRIDYGNKFSKLTLRKFNYLHVGNPVVAAQNNYYRLLDLG